MDEGLVDITLTTDIKKLQIKGNIDAYQDADISCRFPDSTTINEKIRMCARGKSRREACYIPPIMLDFHTPTSPKLYSLSKLKLVIGCGTSSMDEQLLLKEFLIYKIYNLLEEKSFRARLVRVNYRDSRNKMKPYSQYAYLLEDIDDLAQRNGCIASKKISYQIDEMDRAKMNLVDIFEYMIGNTDWSVSANHNIKPIFPRNDNMAKGFPIPYDFDNAGLVNAYYVAPNEILGIENVTQRVYRGFPRKMDEIERTLDIFKAQKEKITALIKGFELLKASTKTEILDYLEGFYKIIDDKTQAQNIFIKGARVN